MNLKNLNILSTSDVTRKWSLFFLLTLFSLLFTSIYAQEVKVKVDTTNIRIGEQFHYQISVNDTSNVIMPKLENLKGLEIVEDVNMDTIEKSLIKKYILTGFDSGAFYIPSQQIFIRNRAHITDSILINVATVKVDTIQQEMFPIKAIQKEPWVWDDLMPYLIWIILGLLLIAGVIGYIIWKKRNPTLYEEEEIIAAMPPFEEAFERLKKLDEKLLWQNNKVKQYYIELTAIVRAYIEKELKIPALESTTDELIETLRDFRDAKTIETSKEGIRKLKELLREADLVKFAKSQPLSYEIEEDRRDAEFVLKELKPKVEEPEVEESKEQPEESPKKDGLE